MTQTDYLESIENVIGSAFGDTIYGNSLGNDLRGLDGNDFLLGMDGSDRLAGGNGDDWVFGGDGNDTIIAGLGQDTSIGGNGTDTFDVSATGASRNYIDLAQGYANFYVNTAGGTVIHTQGLSGFENVTGSALGDIIVGNDLANLIKGGAGSDDIHGGGGNDMIESGDGWDQVFGEGGDDTLKVGTGVDSFEGGDGIDTMDFSGFSSTQRLWVDLQEGAVIVGTALLGNVYSTENLVGSAGGDRLDGDGQANRLSGGNGNDTLSGRGGHDTLIGGAGKDTSTGGAGNDTFAYALASETGVGAAARDIITDFTRGNDKISLSAIDANRNTAADNAFTFIGQNAFSGAAGQLRYVLGSTATIIEGDTNGDRIADFQIELTGRIALAASDFIL
ncbi:MAG: M10 family metallopeptidase C-terminal domain-containing protein [Proteobacteria bacterium]|nr:M10 family metallopeptidase C-terminal domain-containing protein [Pseudomonadota bacterium]